MSAENSRKNKFPSHMEISTNAIADREWGIANA
jgi:hypothetical protein